MKVEDDDIVRAWANYSDAVCASWLMLPEDDDALLKILLQHLPTSRVTWQTSILDAGDSCGECVLGVPLISVHYATVAPPSIHAGSGGVRRTIPF